MKKEVKKLLVLGALSFAVMSADRALASDSDNQINDLKIIVKGYEFGPAVPKLLVKLDQKVSKVSSKGLKVQTAGVKRQVEKVYLSDKAGNKSKAKESRYLTIQMPVTYDVDDADKNASPFVYNMEVFHNQWVKSYPVSIKGLTVSQKKKSARLAISSDAVNKRISPDSDVFKNRGEFSKNYTNPLTKKDEKISLKYAAYEPKNLKSDQKNPLIIWLHGQGEGGTDQDVTLLGNEVTALAKKKVQNHFTAGSQTGAYVLTVQTPTYWMDEGDGTNGSGSGVSRYTQALMDAIKQYVADNEDVDTDRIYLAGCSNGGYMTINMALHYPHYFAALVPQAAAYSYYEHERNADGTYKMVEDKSSISGKSAVRTDKVWFDSQKVKTLKNIPIWFVHSAADKVVNPKNYSLPIYKSLIDSGAKNKWFSYYKNVQGLDMKDTVYNGHWSWTYFFNDQVSGVQKPSAIKKASKLSGFKASNKTKGGSATVKLGKKSYTNVFDWLNDQKK
ncbi:lipase [Streptococcus sp. 'caviae']|nr:lipase [Streptococcus sp. 'caviae']